MTYTIETHEVKKIYNLGKESEVPAVDGVSIKIKEGDYVAIMGASGSGKTTLLDMIGCLMRPTSGKVIIDGVETWKMSEEELADIRGKKIGFIFQQYNLINSFTALENVAFAIRLLGNSKEKAERRAKKLLEIVGLSKRADHRPSQLSGGEQQRVAIARALANNPKIILGDEPTGNLDTKTSKKIMDLISQLNKKEGYTILLITHDANVGKQCDKLIKISDGKIIEERNK
jgi:putative ABC transport system ATP-binding protein